jgi:protein-S-isoprenylcysteine O-methyltransferase Ste14
MPLHSLWGIVVSVVRRGDVARAWIQLLAAVMAATNVAVWVVWSRWERPGYGLELRAQVNPLPLIGRGGDLVQIVPLVYPVLAVIGPGWAYEGWLNWSTDIDLALQAAGLGLWALGIAVGLWAARAIGGYGAVSGVTVDHQLVRDGPYRYVRHPIYTALIAIAVGTTLVYRSYLLLVVAALSIFAHLWWAATEEKLLSSPEGLGDDYRTYASRTGRFLPRVRRT